MKRIIGIIIYCVVILNFVKAQKLPDFVQQRLDSVQKKAERSLMYYRFWDIRNDGDMTLPYYLGYDIFSDSETRLIDSLGLNLSIKMIFNDDMRNRIIQLVRNQYQEWELDSLMNRYIGWSVRSNNYEAFEDCKFDTLQIFKTTLDSFYTDLINKNIEDSIRLRNFEYVEKNKYKYDIFKSLQLDTTAIFKQAYNKVIEKEKEKIRDEQLTDMYSYFSGIGHLAELCGYIEDKRFIQPLIEVFNKPFEFEGSETQSPWQENIYEKVKVALVRLRAEPYYSDYVKHRTLMPEQIKDKKRLDFRLDDFVYVLGTQEAFFELSKYLLSNKPTGTIITDYEDHSESRDYPASSEAFYFIRENIENEEVQEMIGKGYREDYTPYLKPLYDWMQKNYGKYKIRRIW